MTYLFEATQFFHIADFVQCSLHEIPPFFFVFMYDVSGTCAATFVASTYNRNILKGG
jgi:hypothetical protein